MDGSIVSYFILDVGVESKCKLVGCIRDRIDIQGDEAMAVGGILALGSVIGDWGTDAGLSLRLMFEDV